MIYYLAEITIDGGTEINGPPFKFNYYKDPKLISVSPNSGPTKGGTRVKILGEGFTQ